MNFITIDFEIADIDRDTPCQLGLTFVKNNNIVEKKRWLIKPHCYPYFDSFATDIHGIHPRHVEYSPTFEELWPEVLSLINNQFLIAYNAGFQFSVLRNTLDYYEIPYPDVQYACSYIFSKHAFPGLASYSLEYLCNSHMLPFYEYAGETDCTPIANLSMAVFGIKDIFEIEDLPGKLRTNIGSLYPGGYVPCTTKQKPKVRLDISKLEPNPKKLNPDSIFHQSKIVFTGVLSSMTRKDAMQSIIDIGGTISERLTKEVDFLIVGQQNYKVVGDSGMSSKQKSAVKYASQGVPIEILSEEDFLQNL